MLFDALFDYDVKVIKSLYSVSEVGNHWFTTYHIYYKDKLGMIKSTYNLCLLYNFSSFGIVEIQIDDTLILADNDFASIEEDGIRLAKIITKVKKHLTPSHPLNSNGIQIKLNSNKIILIKKSYIGGIFPIIDHVIDSTNSNRIIRKKLSSKE